MSYEGLARMAGALDALSRSNDDSQMTKALSVINNTVNIFGLQKDQLAIQQTDAHNIFVDTVNPENKDNPVPAQIDQEMKNVHTSQADVQMGIMTSIVEGEKGESEILGNNMGQAYLLQQPIVELLKTVTHSLLRY